MKEFNFVESLEFIRESYSNHINNLKFLFIQATNFLIDLYEDLFKYGGECDWIIVNVALATIASELGEVPETIKKEIKIIIDSGSLEKHKIEFEKNEYEAISMELEKLNKKLFGCQQ